MQCQVINNFKEDYAKDLVQSIKKHTLFEDRSAWYQSTEIDLGKHLNAEETEE